MLDQFRMWWDIYPEWQLAALQVCGYVALYLLMVAVAAIIKSFRATATPPPFIDQLVHRAPFVVLAAMTVALVVRLIVMAQNPLYLLLTEHWIIYGVLILADVALLALLASALWSTRE
jgi:hypothetical protein